MTKVPKDTAGDRPKARYSYRQAHEANGFHQFQLLTADGLQSKAKERGLLLNPQPLAQLERLDREGAFSPILFDYLAEDGRPIFRDEHGFVEWANYSSTDGVVDKPRPMYSPWQLLYLGEALDLPTMSVSIDSVLEGTLSANIHPVLREHWEYRLEVWRGLEEAWRPLLLLLIRLQSIYGPSIKGTLTKRTVTLVHDPESGEYVDPHELEDQVELNEMVEEVGVTVDDVKQMHDKLAWLGMKDDPLRYWHMLMRMAPFAQRDKLRGQARRSQEAYDAAEMLRRFYYDLTSELLLNPDDQLDVSDKSWKKRFFGRWPMLRYTREDLAVELRLKDLHPHQVHLMLEGKTELVVCTRMLTEISGMELGEMGITAQLLHGVGGLRESVLRAVKSFPRYVILIADKEGDLEAETERLIEEGVLVREAVLLWDTSFEEANFTDDELISMIAALANERGVPLTLDAATLRVAYDEHRERAGRDAKGLATFALGLSRRSEYGSVVVGKPELADKMADFLLADVQERGADVVGEERPLVQMIVSIFRIT